MTGKTSEIVAVVITTLGIAAAVFWPFFHETDSLQDRIEPGTQLVTLTGLASSGTWTEGRVTGSNYWAGDFRAGRPVLQVGRPTLFRLKSADVMHAFYVPALGIGPIEVYPGHVEEILITPHREGVFGYYCPTMCGDPHFGMRGVIIVQDREGSSPEGIPARGTTKYWMEPPPDPAQGLVARGGWLFRQKGCVTCHGPEGKGGVANYNYVKDTVPALNTLNERLFLFFDEDVEAVISAMESGRDLEELKENPPVPRFNVVLAQYSSVKEVIRNGNPAGKKDPSGPTPPLEMPAWGYRLTDADIEALIAYLLTLHSPEGQG